MFDSTRHPGPQWRFAMLLGVALVSGAAFAHHAESGLNGVDTHALIRTERGGVVWNLPAFTGLYITDSVLKNAKGHTSGYLLMPWNAHGVSRHQEPHPAGHVGNPLQVERDGCALSANVYVACGSTVSEDNVLWYKGSMHHISTN